MPLRAILAAILVAICWGGNYTVTKFALMEFTPFLALLVRFVGVALVLAPFALRLPRPRMRDMFVISFLLIVLQFAFLFTSINMGLSIASVVIASQLGVPFACLMAAIFFKDFLGPWRSFGLMIAFLGVMIVAGTPDAASHWVAFLFAIVASLSWSGANLYLKQMKTPPMVSLLFWPALFSLPQLLLISYVMEDGQIAHIEQASLRAWLCLGYSLVFSSLVGYGLWNWLITKFPMSQVMPYALLMPVAGMGIGMVTFHEPLTTQVLLGGILTIVGVGIISLRRPKLLQMEQ